MPVQIDESLKQQNFPEYARRKYQSEIEDVFGRVKKFFPFLADTPELRAFIGSRVDIGRSPADVAQEILAQPERTGEIRLGAERQAGLELAPQLESLGLEEQGARRAQALALEQLGLSERQATTQAGLARERLGGLRTQLSEDIADAIKNVKRTQEEQQKGFLQSQSQRGLFRSGLTEEGIGKIGLETTETLNRLEKQRANKLAELALQASGVESGLTSAISQAQLQRGSVEQTLASALRQTQLERQRLQTGAGQRTQELFGLGRQAFERGQAGELERALQFEELARRTPEGEFVELPGGQRITGKKKRIVDIDAFNRIVGNPSTIGLPDNILQQLLESIGFTVTA